MAKKIKEEDLDLGIEPQKGSKKKLIIIIAVALLVLLGGGLGVGWFLLSGDEPEQASTEAEGDAAKQQQPALYYPMEPAFVVNLPEGGKARLLQTSVQVMAREQQIIDFIKYNDPMIRHSLLDLLAAKTDAELNSRDGKVKLQSEVIQQLNKLIKEQGGSGEVEAVYFTSFVMQ